MQMRCVNTNRRRESGHESGEDWLKVWLGVGSRRPTFQGWGGVKTITWFDSSNPEELKMEASLVTFLTNQASVSECESGPTFSM